MANAKLLASYDADGAADAQESPSALREEATYFDPLTGKAIDLRASSDAVSALITKDKLLALQNSGELKGRLRPEPATAEYDHVVMDLSSYGEKASEAWKIIRETLRHPQYTVRKNQGGGRFQDINISGTRGIIDWGVHMNRTDGLTHGHLFTHRYVVDTNSATICPLTSMQTKMFANAEFECVNRALLAHGFAPLESIEIGQNPAKIESMPRNQQHAIADAGAAAAANGEDIASVLEDAAAPSLQSQGAIGEAKASELLARGLDAAKAAAAQAAEQYKRASEQAAQMKAALEAIQSRKKLEAQVVEQTAQLAQREAIISARDAVIAERDMALADASVRIERADEVAHAAQQRIIELDVLLHATKEQLSTLNTEYIDVETERDQLLQDKVNLEFQLNAARQDVESQKIVVKDLTEKVIRTETTISDMIKTMSEERTSHQVALEKVNDALRVERDEREEDRKKSEVERIEMQRAFAEERTLHQDALQKAKDALRIEREQREEDRKKAEAEREKIAKSAEDERSIFHKTLDQISNAKDSIISSAQSAYESLKQQFDAYKSSAEKRLKEIEAQVADTLENKNAEIARLTMALEAQSAEAKQGEQNPERNQKMVSKLATETPTAPVDTKVLTPEEAAAKRLRAEAKRRGSKTDESENDRDTSAPKNSEHDPKKPK